MRAHACVHMVCIWCADGGHSYRQGDAGSPAEVACGERFCFSNVCAHARARKVTDKVRLGYPRVSSYINQAHTEGGVNATCT